MSLATYEKIRAIKECDISLIVKDTAHQVVIDYNMEYMYRRFFRIFSAYKYWIWDTFNFETMRVPEAIRYETANHVFREQDKPNELSLPVVTIKLVGETDSSYKYSVVIYDDTNPSDVSEDYRQRFNLTPVRTTNDNGLYKYEFEMTTNKKV